MITRIAAAVVAALTVGSGSAAFAAAMDHDPTTGSAPTTTTAQFRSSPTRGSPSRTNVKKYTLVAATCLAATCHA